MGQQWAARRVRDVSILALPDGSHLVIACDSIGGIGPKAADTVHETAYTTGYFAVRTAILEVLAVGAQPRLIVDNLCFGRGRDADTMIAAMVDVAAEVGLGPSAVTGSTEDNVPTTTTGIGITVIGSATPDQLRAGRSRPGDLVVCLGLPRSAPRYQLTVGEPTMPSIAEVRRALALAGAHEVVPVGSAGIAFELAALAGPAGLTHEVSVDAVDLYSSGGPASCVLVSLLPAALADLRAIRADLPVTVVGHLS